MTKKKKPQTYKQYAKAIIRGSEEREVAKREQLEKQTEKEKEEFEDFKMIFVGSDDTDLSDRMDFYGFMTWKLLKAVKEIDRSVFGRLF